jgi:AmiR/NasT family two-component response regulator
VETELPTTIEACHRLISNLTSALATRDVIGQAKGILMATEAVSEEDAFLILVRASQRANRKLRDIAADVVSANARRSCRQ